VPLCGVEKLLFKLIEEFPHLAFDFIVAILTKEEPSFDISISK
jgi:hypothetical protein